ncbi:hypothetical protein MNB_SV-3-1040 [hydrothermal vent metagenome]|uniref:Uncharacterized protein n=1 Tax=hydrothermal vent metagenome TaxID=652676 RepID=A0A1W1C508_9ZZZZ
MSPDGEGDNRKNCLLPIYKNGKLLKEYTFDEIRRRADEN